MARGIRSPNLAQTQTLGSQIISTDSVHARQKLADKKCQTEKQPTHLPAVNGASSATSRTHTQERLDTDKQVIYMASENSEREKERASEWERARERESIKNVL